MARAALSTVWGDGIAIGVHLTRLMVQFLKTFLLALLVLGLLFAALPALLQLLDIPSFAVGSKPFVLLAWRNEANGTSIQLNILPLIVLAVLVGLVNHWLPHPDRPE